MSIEKYPWLKNVSVGEMKLSEEVLKNLDKRWLSTLGELANIFPTYTRQINNGDISKEVIKKLKNHLWDWESKKIITPNIKEIVKTASHEIVITIEKIIQEEKRYQWREKNPTIDSIVAYDTGMNGSSYEELYHGWNSGLPISEAFERDERILFVEGVKRYDNEEKPDNHKY